LIFFCGKMGAGKSTKSQQFALDRNAVLIPGTQTKGAIGKFFTQTPASLQGKKLYNRAN